MFNETAASGKSPMSLIIGRDLAWAKLTNPKMLFMFNCAPLHLELSPPNHVAQADGKYGVLFRRTKNII
jgi:hypothetical protein